MDLTLIVAMDQSALIGTETGLPWHLPADLKRFRRTTLHKPLIMGRRTHEMIGRALDKRPNIILTRDTNYQSEGCLIAHSWEEAMALATGPEAMIIGGNQIYAMALPHCTGAHLTIIQHKFTGTVYFPMAQFSQYHWKAISDTMHPADEKNPYEHRVLELKRTDPEEESIDLSALLSI